MIDITVDKLINRLVINTDDESLHNFLETRETQYTFNPFTKKWGNQEKLIKIYDPGKHKQGKLYTYKLGLGWTGYILNILSNKISGQLYNKILSEVIMADQYRDVPFTELRDYQNEDILYFMKYKRGLFQVYTGYGKENIGKI